MSASLSYPTSHQPLLTSSSHILREGRAPTGNNNNGTSEEPKEGRGKRTKREKHSTASSSSAAKDRSDNDEGSREKRKRREKKEKKGESKKDKSRREESQPSSPTNGASPRQTPSAAVGSFSSPPPLNLGSHNHAQPHGPSRSRGGGMFSGLGDGEDDEDDEEMNENSHNNINNRSFGRNNNNNTNSPTANASTSPASTITNGVKNLLFANVKIVSPWRLKLRKRLFPYSIRSQGGEDAKEKNDEDDQNDSSQAEKKKTDKKDENKDSSQEASKKKLTNRGVFDWAMTFVNFLVIIVAAAHDYTDKKCLHTRCQVLIMCDAAITAIFFMETILHMMAFGVRKYLHPFRLADLAILLSNTALLAVFLTGNMDVWPSLLILRVMRMFRPMITTTRFPELRVLIVALFKSIFQLTDVVLLFIILLLWFAVAGTNQMSGTLRKTCIHKSYFDNSAIAGKHPSYAGFDNISDSNKRSVASGAVSWEDLTIDERLFGDASGADDEGWAMRGRWNWLENDFEDGDKNSSLPAPITTTEAAPTRESSSTNPPSTTMMTNNDTDVLLPTTLSENFQPQKLRSSFKVRDVSSGDSNSSSSAYPPPAAWWPFYFERRTMDSYRCGFFEVWHAAFLRFNHTLEACIDRVKEKEGGNGVGGGKSETFNAVKDCLYQRYFFINSTAYLSYQKRNTSDADPSVRPPATAVPISTLNPTFFPVGTTASPAAPFSPRFVHNPNATVLIPYELERLATSTDMDTAFASARYSPSTYNWYDPLQEEEGEGQPSNDAQKGRKRYWRPSTSHSTDACSPYQTCTIKGKSLMASYICPVEYECVDNPEAIFFFGYVGFDGILPSFLTVFVSVSFQLWYQVMYMAYDVDAFLVFLFFVALVVIGGILVTQLTTVIITVEFEKAQEEENQRVLALKTEQAAVLDSFASVVQRLVRLTRLARQEDDSRMYDMAGVDVDGNMNGSALVTTSNSGDLEGGAANIDLERIAELQRRAGGGGEANSASSSNRPAPARRAKLTKEQKVAAAAERALAALFALQRAREWVYYNIVATAPFEYTSLFVILLNTIVMCLEREGMPDNEVRAYTDLNYFFVFFWSLEFIFRVFGSLDIFAYLSLSMTWLDIFVVAGMWIDVFLSSTQYRIPFIGVVRSVKVFKLLTLFPKLYVWLQLILRALQTAPMALFIFFFTVVMFACLFLNTLGGQLCGRELEGTHTFDFGDLTVNPNWLRSTATDNFLYDQRTGEYLPLDYYENPEAYGGGGSASLAPSPFTTTADENPQTDDGNSGIVPTKKPETLTFSSFVDASNICEGLPQANFDGIWMAFVTSFQIATGDDWELIMYTAMQSQGVAMVIPFCLYFYLTAYMLLPLLVGIVLTAKEDSDEGVAGGDAGGNNESFAIGGGENNNNSLVGTGTLGENMAKLAQDQRKMGAGDDDEDDEEMIDVVDENPEEEEEATAKKLSVSERLRMRSRERAMTYRASQHGTGIHHHNSPQQRHRAEAASGTMKRGGSSSDLHQPLLNGDDEDDASNRRKGRKGRRGDDDKAAKSRRRDRSPIISRTTSFTPAGRTVSYTLNADGTRVVNINVGHLVLSGNNHKKDEQQNAPKIPLAARILEERRLRKQLAMQKAKTEQQKQSRHQALSQLPAALYGGAGAGGGGGLGLAGGGLLRQELLETSSSSSDEFSDDALLFGGGRHNNKALSHHSHREEAGVEIAAPRGGPASHQHHRDLTNWHSGGARSNNSTGFSSAFLTPRERFSRRSDGTHRFHHQRRRARSAAATSAFGDGFGDEATAASMMEEDALLFGNGVTQTHQVTVSGGGRAVVADLPPPHIYVDDCSSPCCSSPCDESGQKTATSAAQRTLSADMRFLSAEVPPSTATSGQPNASSSATTSRRSSAATTNNTSTASGGDDYDDEQASHEDDDNDGSSGDGGEDMTPNARAVTQRRGSDAQHSSNASESIGEVDENPSKPMANDEPKQQQQDIDDDNDKVVPIENPLENTSQNCITEWFAKIPTRKQIRRKLRKIQRRFLHACDQKGDTIRLYTQKYAPFWMVFSRICLRLNRQTLYRLFIALVTVFGTVVLSLKNVLAAPDSREQMNLNTLETVYVVINMLDVFFVRAIGMGLFLNRGALLFRGGAWNNCDVLLALASLLSLIVDAEPSTDTHSTFNEVLRLIRSVRPFMALQYLPGCALITSTLASSVTQLGRVTAVTFMVMFVLAIEGVRQYRGLLRICYVPMRGFVETLSRRECESSQWNGVWTNDGAHFDNLAAALHTVFSIATLEGWADIMHRLMNQAPDSGQPRQRLSSPIAALYPMAVVIIVGFILSSLFASVLVDSYNKEKRLKGDKSVVAERQIDGYMLTQRRIFRALPIPLQRKYLQNNPVLLGTLDLGLMSNIVPVSALSEIKEVGNFMKSNVKSGTMHLTRAAEEASNMGKKVASGVSNAIPSALVNTITRRNSQARTNASGGGVSAAQHNLSSQVTPANSPATAPAAAANATASKPEEENDDDDGPPPPPRSPRKRIVAASAVDDDPFSSPSSPLKTTNLFELEGVDAVKGRLLANRKTNSGDVGDASSSPLLIMIPLASPPDTPPPERSSRPPSPRNRNGAGGALLEDDDDLPPPPRVCSSLAIAHTETPPPAAEEKRNRYARGEDEVTEEHDDVAVVEDDESDKGNRDGGGGIGGALLGSLASKTLEELGAATRLLSGDNENLDRGRSRLRAFVRSELFINAFHLIVLINIASLSWVSYPLSDLENDIQIGFDITFAVIFAFEFLLKMFAETIMGYFASNWNRLDFFVLAMSIAGVSVSNITGGGRSFALVTSFRIIRLVRLADGTLNIRDLISKISKALASLGNVIIVIAAVFTCFAIIGMELFGRVHNGVYGSTAGFDKHNNFRNVNKGLMLLLRVMTGGNWPDLLNSAKQAAETSGCDLHLNSCGRYEPIPQIFFISFLTISVFILKNLVVAVLVDAFTASGQLVAEDKAKTQALCTAWMQCEDEEMREMERGKSPSGGVDGSQEREKKLALRPVQILKFLRLLPKDSVLGFNHLPGPKRVAMELTFFTRLQISDMKEELSFASVVDVLCELSFNEISTSEAPMNRMFHYTEPPSTAARNAKRQERIDAQIARRRRRKDRIATGLPPVAEGEMTLAEEEAAERKRLANNVDPFGYNIEDENDEDAMERYSRNAAGVLIGGAIVAMRRRKRERKMRALERLKKGGE